MPACDMNRAMRPQKSHGGDQNRLRGDSFVTRGSRILFPESPKPAKRDGTKVRA